VPRHTCAMQDTRRMEASKGISAGEAVLDDLGEKDEGTGLAS